MVGITDTVVREELRKDNLYDIPEDCRGPVYRYLQARFKSELQEQFRSKTKRYSELVQEANIGRWEVDQNFLQGAPSKSPIDWH